MKKLTVLTLCCAMVLSMAACGSNTTTADKQTGQNTATETKGDSTEAETKGDSTEAEIKEDSNEAETKEDSTEAEAREDSSEKTDEDGESDAADSSEQSAADLEAFLSNFAMIGPSEDLFYTGWELVGGMKDGVEMNETDVADFLTAYDGVMQIVFEDMEQISMLQGGNLLPGSYTVADDGITMEIVFDNNGTELSYAGLYVYNAEDIPVFMLLPDASGKNALYFTQIDER